MFSAKVSFEVSLTEPGSSCLTIRRNPRYLFLQGHLGLFAAFWVLAVLVSSVLVTPPSLPPPPLPDSTKSPSRGEEGGAREAGQQFSGMKWGHPLAQWIPPFFQPSFWKGSPLNSTNQERMPVFSLGHWGCEVMSYVPTVIFWDPSLQKMGQATRKRQVVSEENYGRREGEINP